MLHAATIAALLRLSGLVRPLSVAHRQSGMRVRVGAEMASQHARASRACRVSRMGCSERLPRPTSPRMCALRKCRTRRQVRCALRAAAASQLVCELAPRGHAACVYLLQEAQQMSRTPPGCPPSWLLPQPASSCARASAASCRMKPAFGQALGRAFRTSCSASPTRRPSSCSTSHPRFTKKGEWVHCSWTVHTGLGCCMLAASLHALH